VTRGGRGAKQATYVQYTGNVLQRLSATHVHRNVRDKCWYNLQNRDGGQGRGEIGKNTHLHMPLPESGHQRRSLPVERVWQLESGDGPVRPLRLPVSWGAAQRRRSWRPFVRRRLAGRFLARMFQEWSVHCVCYRYYHGTRVQWQQWYTCTVFQSESCDIS
jgi:hypothetical protein